MQTQRDLFDIPEDIAYFNCAYNSPQLIESKNRLIAGVNAKCHPWERTPSSFFDDAETLRQLAAKLFGGDVDGYAIVPAASYGLSTAARAIEPFLTNGAEVLLMAEEFPSNVLPWRRVAFETGAIISTVPTPDNGDWTQAIIAKLNKNVKVVALTTCHWTNGASIDLKAIGEACRLFGSILVVDATQSLGAVPFSIDEVKPDFLVAAGYKWLLCPYGFSLLYVSENWRNARPLEETWLARENAENFAGLVNYSDNYMAGSRRFDVGQKCTPTILPGAVVALEQIERWGVENIAMYLSEINTRISQHLERLGFQVPNDKVRSPHMFGATLPANYSGNFVADLKTRNIFVSQRGNSLRFAPHLHINETDLDRLLSNLTLLIEK